jgi:hypothetical protein
MTLDIDGALERVLSSGDEWQSWRALRIAGDDPGEAPAVTGQDEFGAFQAAGRPAVGMTGLGLCHLVVIGLRDGGAAAIAADWLEDARTPAGAWLDAPDAVPGELDTVAGARVWATASATCALQAVGRGPGPRAIDLLRGEADVEGRFTGGVYPTAAAAGAYWLAEGPKTEMAEWALRWTRENVDEFDAQECAFALTFWLAASIPADHPSVEVLAERIKQESSESGFEELGLTMHALELLYRLEEGPL